MSVYFVFTPEYGGEQVTVFDTNTRELTYTQHLLVFVDTRVGSVRMPDMTVRTGMRAQGQLVLENGVHRILAEGRTADKGVTQARPHSMSEAPPTVGVYPVFLKAVGWVPLVYTDCWRHPHTRFLNRTQDNGTYWTLMGTNPSQATPVSLGAAQLDPTRTVAFGWHDVDTGMTKRISSNDPSQYGIFISAQLPTLKSPL